MFWKSAYAKCLVAVLLGSATIAKADDQQLVEDYLKSRGANGAAVRPIVDGYVGRAFPNFSFFGVVFRQYPVAMLCPQTQDLQCSNVFFVKNGQVDFVSTIEDLKFFFATELQPAPSKEAATDAASTWLRFSEELKQDLFYTFSTPEISYMPREDTTSVRGHAAVTAGGQGHIEMLMTLGTAGGLINIHEKAALQPGVRPICQATKLLDRDPIVRRMAEQDLLVMGRGAKPYLDQVRGTARPELQEAIDRIWQRIVREGR
ncbi:MAG TPA: hypothetical protein VK335_19035 [Bryobacteraceae bacterium]|nr:hypothetical protein [Bryobacteraceae bacterium]HXR17625.1 hypothetical protein [Terriglobales bacterium]HZW95659.1 hypothetical protein [Candidatus Eremiobacteraceae bacterium]